MPTCSGYFQTTGMGIMDLARLADGLRKAGLPEKNRRLIFLLWRKSVLARGRPTGFRNRRSGFGAVSRLREFGPWNSVLCQIQTWPMLRDTSPLSRAGGVITG